MPGLRGLFAALVGVLLAGALAAQAQAAPTPDAVGDWLGTLTVRPGLDLRVAVHIRKSPQGLYSATWDSLDQGLFDAPARDVAVSDDKLSFATVRPDARYAATWDSAASRWLGQWSQVGKTFPLDLARGLAPPGPVVADMDGEWDGTLYMGTGLNLRLAFHVATGPHGTLVTGDSPDQGQYGAPLSSISREGDHVRITSKLAGYVIDGELADGGQTLNARFTQGGQPLPLTLKRLPAGAPSPWPAPAAAAMAAPPANWTVPSDAEIKTLLAERIDVQHQGVGIVVGVIDASGRRIVAYGESGQANGRPLDGDTEFEIGSITKVFTALVLADMVDHGEVKLDDPAAKYLPADVRMPERDGKAITLVDLATHTSGLPRLPTNMAPKDPANPYADYTVAQLYQFLSGYRLTRDPGTSWAYSNLGFGLLGHVLARRAGMDYQALVKTRVLQPLGMASTAVTLTPDEAARLAVGHDSNLRPVENWDLPTLAGAGALRSTANDLLTFVAANLGYVRTPLQDDMALLLSVQRPTETPNLSQALGWEVLESPSGEIVQHGGGTGGYHTLIAFNRKTRVGVVVMTNAETVMGADDIGLHILTGSPVAALPPPPPPPPERHAISLPPEALEHLVGRYQLAPRAFITITRDGDRLLAQLTGQSAYEVFPDGPTSFFWKIVDAELTFDPGPDGHAVGLVLHQNGRDLPGTRVP
jgi:CubicO group peptidase (beta-lactamase class C family)